MSRYAYEGPLKPSLEHHLGGYLTPAVEGAFEQFEDQLTHADNTDVFSSDPLTDVRTPVLLIAPYNLGHNFADSPRHTSLALLDNGNHSYLSGEITPPNTTITMRTLGLLAETATVASDILYRPATTEPLASTQDGVLPLSRYVVHGETLMPDNNPPRHRLGEIHPGKVAIAGWGNIRRRLTEFALRAKNPTTLETPNLAPAEQHSQFLLTLGEALDLTDDEATLLEITANRIIRMTNS